MSVHVCALMPAPMRAHLIGLLGEALPNTAIDDGTGARYIVTFPAHFGVYADRADVTGQIVTPLWLLHCCETERVLSCTGYSADPCCIFSGCIVSLSAVSQHRREVFEDIVRSFGGRVSTFSDPRCTHIVYETRESQGPISYAHTDDCYSEEALRHMCLLTHHALHTYLDEGVALRKGSAAVTTQWLLSSLKARKRLDAKKFLISPTVAGGGAHPLTLYEVVSQTDHLAALYAKVVKRGRCVALSPAYSHELTACLETVISHLGGVLVLSLADTLNGLLISPDELSVTSSASVVNHQYIFLTVEINALPSVHPIAHTPLRTRFGIPSMRVCVVSLSGFREYAPSALCKSDVIALLEAIGAAHTTHMQRGITTHLVVASSRAGSDKTRKACAWGNAIHVVGVEWLLACVQTWGKVDESPFNIAGASVSSRCIEQRAVAISPPRASHAGKAVEWDMFADVTFQYDVDSQTPLTSAPADEPEECPLAGRVDDDQPLSPLREAVASPLLEYAKREEQSSGGKSPSRDEPIPIESPIESDITKPVVSQARVDAAESLLLITPMATAPLEHPSHGSAEKENTSNRRLSGLDTLIAAAALPHMDRSDRSSKRMFLLGGLHLDRLEECMAMVASLGGGVVDTSLISSHAFDASCTHVVIQEPLKRTEKFLCGCVAGKWILHPDYIADSFGAGCFLDEEQYAWGNPIRPQQLQMVGSIWPGAIAKHRTASSLPFAGLAFVISPDITDSTKVALLRNLILVGGGSLVTCGALTVRQLQMGSKPDVILYQGEGVSSAVNKHCIVSGIRVIRDVALMDAVTMEDGDAILASLRVQGDDRERGNGESVSQSRKKSRRNSNVFN